MSLQVLAAAYDDPADALADCDAIAAAYADAGAPHDLDAAVVVKDRGGDVSIMRRHDPPARPGAVTGLRRGLAVGAVAALFPGVGLVGALLVGGGAGASLGAVTGHTASSISRGDLDGLAEVLDEGDAGLVVVYWPEMADRVTASVRRARRVMQRRAAVRVEELAVRARDERSSEPHPT